MIVEESLIALAKDQPLHAVVEVRKRVSAAFNGKGSEWTSEEYNALLEGYLFVDSMLDANLLEIKVNRIILSGDLGKDCTLMNDFLIEMAESISAEIELNRIEEMRGRFRAELGAGFFYEFSQGDLERVQHLINTLRSEIALCEGLEDDHRERLMGRLEKLQKELHKKVSSLDRFWGLIGDGGVVLGKLGKDAKPLVDRIREIAEIVWQTQARTEELPSGTLPPLIGKDEDA